MTYVWLISDNYIGYQSKKHLTKFLSDVNICYLNFEDQTKLGGFQW